MIDERVMARTPHRAYPGFMDTKTFEIYTTVKDEDAQAAEEKLQTILDELKEEVPGVVVGEIIREPAYEERHKTLRCSEVHLN